MNRIRAWRHYGRAASQRGDLDLARALQGDVPDGSRPARGADGYRADNRQFGLNPGSFTDERAVMPHLPSLLSASTTE
jgi:hypothetical protein